MRQVIITIVALALAGAAAFAGQPQHARLLDDNGSSVRIEFTAGDYRLEPVVIDGRTYQRVIMPGTAPMLVAGAPELPIAARSVIIPDRGGAEVRVTEIETETVPGVDVVPSKGNLYRTVDPATVPYEFGRVYQQAGPYPAAVVELSPPFISRDFRGVTVKFHPVRYDPARRELTVVKRLVAEVVPAAGNDTNPLARRSGTISREFIEGYRELFLNYQPRAARYDTLSDNGLKLLVITADAYRTNLQPLVEWKRRKGFSVKVANVSAIGNNATSIKNYIANEYTANGISYVLLVGEATEVAPAAGTTGAASGETSDPQYACLSGSDRYPELYVSRFSAGSAARVDVQVAKSVKYERNPLIGGAWYGRATGLASSEGTPPDYDRMNWVRDTLLYYEYDRVDQIYQPSATNTQVRDSVNAGRGLINYIGHGGTTNWVNPPFSVTDVNGLTNTDLLPVVNSVACVVGDFAGTATCFCEAWQWAGTAAQPRGSVVHYGSSINQSWVPPTISQMESARLLSQRKRVTSGGFFFNGSQRMIEYYAPATDGDEMFETWHIFGDASVPIRSDVPVQLSVGHPATVAIGPAVPFAVHVERSAGGAAVPGALVCALVRGDSSKQFTAYTDASGNATLAVTTTAVDTVYVTVTGHNLAPYEGYAIAAVPAMVTIDPDTITVNVPTAVTVTVSEPGTGTPVPNVAVTISGYGIQPALADTTDGSGIASFNVTAPYGEVLAVRGREVGESYDMFTGSIWVTGGAALTASSIVAQTYSIGLTDTLMPGFETQFGGTCLPDSFDMFISGCGIDISGSSPDANLFINGTPTVAGTVTGVIAKNGYDIYTKQFPCRIVYGTLTGTIVEDGTSALLPGVRVVGTAGADTAFDVLTNGSGVYAVTDSLPCGNYTWSISKFGYLDFSEPFTLMHGYNLKDGILHPAPSGDVSGAVTQAGTGIPLAATVNVYRTDNGSLYATTTTDSAAGGTYSVAGLPYFNYSFEVRAYHHRKTTRTVTVDGPGRTEDFALETTQGDILVINDHDAKEVERSKVVGEDKQGRPLVVANDPAAAGAKAGESAALFAGLLGELGYSVTSETAAATDPGTWTGYDAVVWSCGPDQSTLSVAAYRTNLVNFVNGGGKVLLEGGEIAYDWDTEDATFASTVMHANDWDTDNAGALTLQQAGHALATAPNALPASLAVAYGSDYGDQDASKPTNGGVVVYGTTSYAADGGIIAYDDDGDPTNGQVVFYLFNFQVLADSATRAQVLENSIEYLLRPSAPPASTLSGVARLSGQSDHSGIVVTATLGGTTYYDTTDAAGSYGMTVFDGSYRVAGTMAGYVDTATNRQAVVSGTGSANFVIYPATVAFEEDFEGGNGGLTGTGDWQYGVPTSGPGAAHSGTQLWATNLAGNYANNSNSTLTLPVINGLPAAMTLELWHWHSFEGTTTLYDGGNVKASTDGGSSWTVIAPAGGYTGTAYASTPGVGGQQIFGGSSGGWLKKSFDLASYAGQDLTLRLHFGSDNIVNSYPGWYVDDIMVYGVDFTGIAGKPEIAGALPSQYRLGAAYPNPARGMATIAYSLPREGELELIVYNIAGQKVRTLARGAQPAGHHRACWDGRDEAGKAVSAGVYLYRLTAPGWSRTGKLSLVR